MGERLGFVNLRVRTAYSLLEGALPIPKLVELAQADGQPALACTDRNNLFGALEFSETLRAAGIQPIIGCSLAVRFDDTAPATPAKLSPSQDAPPRPHGFLALLAKDATGYANLMKLSSMAFLDSQEAAEPHVPISALAKHSEGLIALSGGLEGPLDICLTEGHGEMAARWCETLAAMFPDRFYIELQRYSLPGERDKEQALVTMAYDQGLPLVATSDAYFPTREDYEAHDALICIAEGSYLAVDERRKLTPHHHFRSRKEMMTLFSDLPEALENTIEIARRCAFRVPTRAPILPQFVEGAETDDPKAVLAREAEELRTQAHAGLDARLTATGPAEGYTEADYRKRLDYELDIITQMKFPGYFLIVSDFIKWAKAQGIPVGPGRGSGAGSLVAWSLTITDLDPIRFGLLFERFLNPERVSMPDFDIDFCQTRRDEVIRYVQEKYGADRVAQIITFGKLQARAVMRDVGRVLQMPYGQVDRLCKLVPNNPANPVTLAEAIAGEPKLQEARDSEPIVARMLAIAQKLEGLYRHASTHAAGVVIADRPLTELVPLYHDPRAALPATQFNMKWVEKAGLVKFDFLGLKTLTVIRKAIELIARKGVTVDFSRDDLKDPATYDLLARADTIGVFQLESSGMREHLAQLKPDRFEDIIAMVALYRPGPMDNIPTYINRKYGLEPPDYLHERLKPILEETYGVIIYQEQVMQIAQELSGYSLGEADLLRRAMGKKIKAEMEKQRSRFVEGAVARGVDKAQAVFIFELVDKFAGYGFNKSHAAAYALLAYQTAYLKANHPVEFMAAIMTLDQGNTDKIHLFYEAAREMGIEILPPAINHSGAEFLPEDGAIRYSLAALKNIGLPAVEHIVALRETGGPFESLADFAGRIDPHIVNKRALETLAAAGAFDELEPDRARVYGNVERILAVAGRRQADQALGQNSLFGDELAMPALELGATEKWLPLDKLAREQEAVGFYLSGHPLDSYSTLLEKLKVTEWRHFAEQVRKGQSAGMLAATVTYRQDRRSKKGTPFAFAGFSDRSGQFEAIVFSDTLATCRDLLEPGTPVLLSVEAEMDGDMVKVRVQSVKHLDAAAERVSQGLRLVIERPDCLPEIKNRINGGGRGKLTLVLRLADMKRDVEIRLPEGCDPSPRQADELALLPGVVSVERL